MALYVIATPISKELDLGTRAGQVLNTCPVIIAEDMKNAQRLLKKFEIKDYEKKEIYLLNEHTLVFTKEKNSQVPSKEGKLSQKYNKDFLELIELCKKQNCALISDCGTPNFCDPGSELVRECHNQNIPVQSIPGPSSLSAFISVCGHKLENFLFWGFLPQNQRERQNNWKKLLEELRHQKRPIILLDTPYRLQNVLELCTQSPYILSLTLGLELGSMEERIIEGEAHTVKKKVINYLHEHENKNALFILMLHYSHPK